MPHAIALLLGEYRKQHRLTLTAMGDRLGLSCSHLYQLERGTVLPSLVVLRRISEFLHLDPIEIGLFVLKVEGRTPGRRRLKPFKSAAK